MAAADLAGARLRGLCDDRSDRRSMPSPLEKANAPPKAQQIPQDIRICHRSRLSECKGRAIKKAVGKCRFYRRTWNSVAPGLNKNNAAPPRRRDVGRRGSTAQRTRRRRAARRSEQVGVGGDGVRARAVRWWQQVKEAEWGEER